MSMETDAQSYTGVPLRGEPESEADPAVAQTSVAAQVQGYRQALAEAARHGRLTDQTGSEIADEHLKLAAASPSASALIAFERDLRPARRAALQWSGGKTDRSTEVIVLERLADQAAQRVAIDLAFIG